jgi:hypothetical protein
VTQSITERLHIIEGSDWKDAVIALLEPRSPYRPWRYGFGEAHEGDPVAVVLNTDPCAVLTDLGRVGADGNPAQAVVNKSYPAPGLIDLATLVMVANFKYDEDPRYQWQLRGDAAIQMELALTECKLTDDSELRFGHTSVAAARILLRSQGRCAGCDTEIGLSGDDARDLVQIHTVDPPQRPAPEPPIKVHEKSWAIYDAVDIVFTRTPPDLPADWPGVLCRRCHSRMQEGEYSGLLDFRLAQHPTCPRCGARRTQRALFGMLMSRDFPPWLDPRGCCVTEDVWTCTECTHTW